MAISPRAVPIDAAHGLQLEVAARPARLERGQAIGRPAKRDICSATSASGGAVSRETRSPRQANMVRERRATEGNGTAGEPDGFT